MCHVSLKLLSASSSLSLVFSSVGLGHRAASKQNWAEINHVGEVLDPCHEVCTLNRCLFQLWIIKRDAKNTRRCSITMLPGGPGAPRVSFHPLPAPVHPVHPVHPSQCQPCPCQAVLPQAITPLPQQLPQQLPPSLEPRRLVARVGSVAPAALAAAPPAAPAAAAPAVGPRSQAAPKSLLRRSTAAAAAEPCTALAPLGPLAREAPGSTATGSRNCANGARRRKSLPEPELLVVKLCRICNCI